MKGEKEGNFAKSVMNVEAVTLEVLKERITARMNVSFGFSFQQSTCEGVDGSENTWP